MKNLIVAVALLSFYSSKSISQCEKSLLLTASKIEEMPERKVRLTVDKFEEKK